MNFFTQLSTLGQGMDVALRIKGKNGRLTVAVEPQLANASRLKPLVLTGTPEELDEGFIAQFDGVMTTARGLDSNLAEVKQDATELAKAPAKKEQPGRATPAPAAKKGKDQPAKRQEKPKKPEQQVPQPADMFSDPPAHAPSGEKEPSEMHEMQSETIGEQSDPSDETPNETE